MAKSKPLTVHEEQRMIEIRYYLFVEHLLNKYNRSAIIYTIIETLADLFSCNVTILKNLTQNINNRSSSIVPTKVELGLMLYRTGVPVRKIRNMINLHPQTLYRFLESFEKDPYEFHPKTDDEVREQVKLFLDELEGIMKWF